MYRVLILAIFILACLPSSSCQSYTTTLTESPGRVDEGVTISTLRSIATAQTSYSVGNDGNYGTFTELSEGGFLDSRFNSQQPVLNGYVLTMTTSEKSADGASYSCNADPENTPANARGRHFYIDSASGIIHVNPTQQASANDPAFQP